MSLPGFDDWLTDQDRYYGPENPIEIEPPAEWGEDPDEKYAMLKAENDAAADLDPNWPAQYE